MKGGPDPSVNGFGAIFSSAKIGYQRCSTFTAADTLIWEEIPGKLDEAFIAPSSLRVGCQNDNIITSQGEDAEKIVNQHIKLLHRYNEAKDATQILIGRLANLKEITVRQIHKDLELPIGD
ncbi:Swi5-domain-containing protein [Lentinula raphanica]|nr:Swi5-domain-containing protein [Lentinula raphanica]